MIAILRPIKKNPWSGLIKYRNCYEDLGSYFTRSGGLYTGLTDGDAERIGKVLGLDLGRNSDFWKTFFIRTTDKDLYLNLDDPHDELKYLFLKNHKRVKTSLTDRKATADFVMINKEEEARKENIYNKQKRDAIRYLDTMTIEEMRKALRLYGHNADDMSSEMVENRLFSVVEGDPHGFIRKWIDNPSKETQFIISQAISKNVIRRNRNLYNYGSEIIGRDLGEAVAFLDDPKNQDIKIAILKSIDAKNYFTSKSFDQEEQTEEEPKEVSKKKTSKKIKETE